MDYSRKDGKPGFTRRNKDGSTTFISLEDLEREGKKEQFLRDLEKNTGKTFRQWEDSWLKRRGEEQLKRDAEKLKSQSQAQQPQAQQPQSQNPTPTPIPIKVEPYKDTGSFFDGARGGKYDTTTNPTPPKTLTPQQRAYGPDSKLTKDQQLANLEYDKKRYETDDKGNPILGKLRSDQTSAKEFGLKANAANFPNQRIFIDPETGKRKSKFSGFTNSTTTKNPTNAAAGGVNPRLGTYAMMQQANMNNLMSNDGRSKKPILPVSQRPMKQEAYDLVLDYLLSEGHVDTVEEAHYVMLQMTSEHVQEVVEAYVVTLADKKGNTKAYQNYKSGMKNKITGEPLYKAAPHLKGV